MSGTARPYLATFSRLPAGFDPATRHALQRAVQALSSAEQARQPAAMCQALAELARCLASAGELAAAEKQLRRALRWSVWAGSVDLRTDLLSQLAELACRSAEQADADGEDTLAVHRCQERARDRAFEAACLAGRTSDAHWEARVLLRASDVLNRCGDHSDAAAMQQRAIALMGRHDPELAAMNLHEPAALAAPAALM
jgi:tetratricopeptide (TPR) repeat protein